MSLRSEVESIRDITTAQLSAAHDHFAYTKKLWRIAEVEIRRRNRKIVLSNPVAGSRVTEQDLLKIAQSSVSGYLPSSTLQQFASLTETFLTDLVRMWITAFPVHLKGQVDVQAIVSAADKDSILRPLIDQHVMSVGYKRPSEWFKYLNGIVSLQCPTDAEIGQFAEFKASRDVFVHHRGIVSEIYLEKAGNRARAGIGRPLDLPDSYLHDGFRLCRKIVTDVGTAAAAKA